MSTKEKNQLPTREENSSLEVSRAVDMNVSQNDLIDMVINEEITKIQTLREELNVKCNEKFQLHKKLVEELHPKETALVLAALKQHIDKVNKTYLKKGHALQYVLSSFELRRLVEDKGHERKEKKSNNLNDSSGGMYRNEWHEGPRNDLRNRSNKMNPYSTSFIHFYNSKQLAEIKVCGTIDKNYIVEDKRGDLRYFECEMMMPFQHSNIKVDYSSIEKLEKQIEEADEERKELDKQISALQELQGTTKQKRDEIKAGLTRGNLSQTEEGKAILAQLDKTKAGLNIKFDAKSFLSNFKK